MVIGSMVANLGLNYAQFTSGLSAARGQLAGFGNAATSKMSGITSGLASGLGAMIGVGTFGALTASSMKAVDETGELADTLGTTTEKLVGLQHAAQLGGSSTEGLTKGLQKMAVNLGAARQGTGSAKGMLDQFGLSADALAAQDPSDVFVTLADKIAQLPSASDRASAALKIFGKSGVEMLPMLTGGAEGIQAMMDEAKNLGMTFSNLDSQKVAAANDSIDRMKGAIGGLFNQVAIGAAPMISMLADGFTSLAPIAQGTFQWIGDFAMDSIAVIGWAIENIGPMAEYAFKSAALSVVTFGAQFMHSLTVELPTVLGWFVDNFVNMFSTAASFTTSIFTNLASNIGSLMSELWKFISSGGTHQMANTWTPLLTGFENTVAQLPNIPERAIGDMERGLMTDVNRIGTQLGDSLGDTMNASWEDRKLVPPPLKTGSDIPLESIPSSKKTTDKSSGQSGPVNAQVNSIEAYKLIRSSGAAQNDAKTAYAKKMADKQLKESQSQTSLLRQIAGNTGSDDVEEADF